MLLGNALAPRPRAPLRAHERPGTDLDRPRAHHRGTRAPGHLLPGDGGESLAPRPPAAQGRGDPHPRFRQHQAPRGAARAPVRRTALWPRRCRETFRNASAFACCASSTTASSPRWSRPTSRRAACTSPTSATCSITTCRRTRGLCSPHRPNGPRRRRGDAVSFGCEHTSIPCRTSRPSSATGSRSAASTRPSCRNCARAFRAAILRRRGRRRPAAEPATTASTRAFAGHGRRRRGGGGGRGEATVESFGELQHVFDARETVGRPRGRAVDRPADREQPADAVALGRSQHRGVVVCEQRARRVERLAFGEPWPEIRVLLRVPNSCEL